MTVDFYHATRQPLGDVLPRLVAKAYASGARLLLTARDAAALGEIDRRLWTYEPESFLPHAVDGPDAARQPVLLSLNADAPANGATILLAAGCPLPPAWLAYARALRLFEAADTDDLAAARGEWRAMPADARTYWKQGAGGWEKA